MKDRRLIHGRKSGNGLSAPPNARLFCGRMIRERRKVKDGKVKLIMLRWTDDTREITCSDCLKALDQ